MENIRTTSSTTATIERKVFQPRLIIQALVFTSILYYSVGHTPPDTTGKISPSVRSATLSASVGNSVLQYASQQLGLPTSELRIVYAQPQNWSDDCLELRESGVSCIQMPVPGWQVAIATKKQRWIYRTNGSGTVIRLEGGTSSPSTARKEAAIAQALR